VQARLPIQLEPQMLATSMHRDHPPPDEHPLERSIGGTQAL
jgi:hypothetical protein